MPTPHQGQGSRRHHHNGTLRPPQKYARRKVKHQPEETRAEGGDGRRSAREEADVVEGALEIEHASRDNARLDQKIQRIALDDEIQDQDDVPQDSKLQIELRHLHARIHNVQLSLQTGQGLAHPPTWRTNGLLPVRNAAKEWSSIVRYHLSVDDDGRVDAAAEALLRSTAPRVFGLIQMALQTGPLVGSNPGYFKRCGGDVAALACEFLGDILEVAAAEGHGGAGDGRHCGARGAARAEATEEALVEDGDEGRSPTLGADPGNDDDACGSDEDCASESSDSAGGVRNVPRGGTLPAADGSLTPQLTNNLQRTLLFSEKQAQRFCQWRRSAEKARDHNRPPSASSKKLQEQKSKKQKQKELKVQRKAKKKKKGGEG